MAPDWFAEMGAIQLAPRGGLEPEYQINTVYGRLVVTFFENWIATRFDDHKLASKYLDSNPFSGKWNFLGENHEEEFNQRLSKILK
jgi:hypothetical protein